MAPLDGDLTGAHREATHGGGYSCKKPPGLNLNHGNKSADYAEVKYAGRSLIAEPCTHWSCSQPHMSQLYHVCYSVCQELSTLPRKPT